MINTIFKNEKLAKMFDLTSRKDINFDSRLSQLRGVDHRGNFFPPVVGEQKRRD